MDHALDSLLTWNLRPLVPIILQDNDLLHETTILFDSFQNAYRMRESNLLSADARLRAKVRIRIDFVKIGVTPSFHRFLLARSSDLTRISRIPWLL